MIERIFNTGAPIFPSTPTGRPLGKITSELEIHNWETLIKFYRRGVRRFIFRPIDAGLIGLDVDVKNSKNGFEELIRLTPNDPREHFHVITPSLGYHLYYLSEGADYVSAEIRPGLEVKNRAFITLPGSQSDRGRYIQRGDPADIPPLPESLRRIIPVRNANQSPILSPKFETIEFSRIAEVLQKQGVHPIKGQRNRFCFEFARFAFKQGHTADDVIQFLYRLFAGNFPLSEIQSAVRSAYRRIV